MPIEGGELAALIGTVVTTGGAAVFGLGKWLGAHFEKLSDQHAREKTEQRADFLRAIETRDREFIGSLERIEGDCHKDREVDREQRAEDRAILLRAIGLATTGDTGTFRLNVEKKKKRGGSSEDMRESGS